MSKISIEGNASGTGTLTIAAPNTNTNRTLTIPDATTTIVGTDATQTLTNKTINASQLVDASITAAKLDGAQSGSAPIYAARAWVNFNGTTNVGGFCTINASGNVSSVADNGTGDYTVNFTTAMLDANYTMAVSTGQTSGGSAQFTIGQNLSSVSRTTSSIRLLSRYIGVSVFAVSDVSPAELCFFR